MTTLTPDKIPPIFFNQFDHLNDFHFIGLIFPKRSTLSLIHVFLIIIPSQVLSDLLFAPNSIVSITGFEIKCGVKKH